MQSNFSTALIPLFISLLTSDSLGQITDSVNFKKRTHLEVEAQAVGTTGGVVPFWMRSNRHGSIPLNGASSSFLARGKMDYKKIADTSRKIGYWGWGFEGRVNVGKKQEVVLPEAYIKGQVGPFQLKAGRDKEIMGLIADTSLSSGSFSISGNALGIPKVEISFPDYYTLPVLDGLIAVKGTISHGWIGRVKIADRISAAPPSTFSYPTLNNEPVSYLHQKALYGRIGKPTWRMKLYGGINHQVFWGSEKSIFGSAYKLSGLATYYYVFTGQSYGIGIIPRSKIGNQLGSIDLSVEYQFDRLKVHLYRQNIYDVGALYYLANLRDGLNGILLENRGQHRKNIRWHKFLVELLYTRNQAGEAWSKTTPSGDEDYYNNYFYTEGWSYKDAGMGTPFISNKSTTRKDLPGSGEYFNNNRVIALHTGIEFKVGIWQYQARGSYSINYGTFGTSPTGHSTGHIRHPPSFPYFNNVKQLSLALRGTKQVTHNTSLTFETAYDRGGLLNNSIGGSIIVTKLFD